MTSEEAGFLVAIVASPDAVRIANSAMSLVDDIGSENEFQKPRHRSAGRKLLGGIVLRWLAK